MFLGSSSSLCVKLLTEAYPRARHRAKALLDHWKGNYSYWLCVPKVWLECTASILFFFFFLCLTSTCLSADQLIFHFIVINMLVVVSAL